MVRLQESGQGSVLGYLGADRPWWIPPLVLAEHGCRFHRVPHGSRPLMAIAAVWALSVMASTEFAARCTLSLRFEPNTKRLYSCDGQIKSETVYAGDSAESLAFSSACLASRSFLILLAAIIKSTPIRDSAPHVYDNAGLFCAWPYALPHQ